MSTLVTDTTAATAIGGSVTASSGKTLVSVTLSAGAYCFFESRAKADHRTLSNYLFVQLEKLFEREQQEADKQQTAVTK